MLLPRKTSHTLSKAAASSSHKGVSVKQEGKKQTKQTKTKNKNKLKALLNYHAWSGSLQTREKRVEFLKKLWCCLASTGMMERFQLTV